MVISREITGHKSLLRGACKLLLRPIGKLHSRWSSTMWHVASSTMAERQTRNKINIYIANLIHMLAILRTPG